MVIKSCILLFGKLHFWTSWRGEKKQVELVERQNYVSLILQWSCGEIPGFWGDWKMQVPVILPEYS